jgi:hypothetical protein
VRNSLPYAYSRVQLGAAPKTRERTCYSAVMFNHNLAGIARHSFVGELVSLTRHAQLDANVVGGPLFVGLRVLAVVLALAVLCGGSAADAANRSRGIWLAPGPGTLDFIRLFQQPQEWPHARQLFNVFKVYQQHTQTPAPSIVGQNTYTALATAGVFRTLNTWGKKLAIEAGSVKEFYCTPDPSGMQTSISQTVDSIRAVQAAGGTVSYIAMDEPFVSGRAKVCGGPALEPTADRVQTYVNGVHAAASSVQIGLIEAYPFSSADAIERMLDLLKERGATPAFLHMDVDWHLSGTDAFVRDMRRLQSATRTMGIPFGIIITGYSGDADALYAVDVYGITNLIAQAFGTWDALPDDLIFQSWAVSRTGLLITPSNLPEAMTFTHTNMLSDIYRRLRGMAGAAIGPAVTRR